MRHARVATLFCTALALAGLVQAGGQRDAQPEARAYLSIGFGGRAEVPRDFFYGLRLDHSARSGAGLAPLMQLDFNRQGLNDARINGLPFARPARMQQDEGETAAGSTSRFANFTATDWTLFALGAAGIGFALQEVIDSKDTPERTGTGTGGTGSTGTTPSANTVANTVNATVNTVANTVTNTVTNAVNMVANAVNGFTDGREIPGALPVYPQDRLDPAYDEWLNGGTGQMGDLGG